MNKGVVPQGTKNEKTISISDWKGTFNPAVKDSNYFGNNDSKERQPTAESEK